MEKIADVDVAAKKKKYSPIRQNSKQRKLVPNESESRSDFHPLSSTEGEAGYEERRRVGLLSVGQVGAKHQQLAYVVKLSTFSLKQM